MATVIETDNYYEIISGRRNKKSSINFFTFSHDELDG
jgi:hypothetical protein